MKIHHLTIENMKYVLLKILFFCIQIDYDKVIYTCTYLESGDFFFENFSGYLIDCIWNNDLDENVSIKKY